jgi:hypothetical protein
MPAEALNLLVGPSHALLLGALQEAPAVGLAAKDVSKVPIFIIDHVFHPAGYGIKKAFVTPRSLLPQLRPKDSKLFDKLLFAFFFIVHGYIRKCIFFPNS